MQRLHLSTDLLHLLLQWLHLLSNQQLQLHFLEGYVGWRHVVFQLFAESDG